MATLETISKIEDDLTGRYKAKLQVNRDLDRTLVSFQANKKQNGYRWFKYKEGFSADLVHYILRSLGAEGGRLIDPFAGSGAALFASASVGIDGVGIELLPVGCEVIRARQIAKSDAKDRVIKEAGSWLNRRPWTKAGSAKSTFSHLRITDGAFPPETESHLASYLLACDELTDGPIRAIMRFAAMCVLEEISYTRKDGQYLRWDHRSGRRQGAKIFDKGKVFSFSEAIERKLTQIRDDLSGNKSDMFAESESQIGSVRVVAGSCLDCLPATQSGSFDCLITSPPYCNRYDYTRTYALELAFLGVSEDRLKELRQTMISCTVENRIKDNLDSKFGKSTLDRAERILRKQEFLNQTFAYLESQGAAGLLNNPGIPRMVKNYFWEMTLVILECARILRPGAPLIMVNDNVRYQGAGIPVDLVLSDIATDAGFDVERIWVLPVGKGNSSQQMGRHGRDELRKCVYIWRAPKGKRAKRSDPLLAVEQSN